jgi:adenylate cyclase
MKKLKFFIIPFIIFIVLRILSVTSFWQNIEHKSKDRFFLMRGTREISDGIVIVEIGDDTFNSLNERWPFPRDYHAHLIENLEKAGAKQIIFDIEFTEKTNPTSDELFARTASKYNNIILAGKLIKTVYTSSTREQLLAPINLITQRGVEWGTVNISADADGFVRKYELFQRKGKEIKLSIGVLSLVKTYWLEKLDEEVKNLSGYFRIGGNLIPKVTSKSTLINYYGPAGTFERYDFADVIDDSTFTIPTLDLDLYYANKDSLKNKIVLVGLTSVEFHDTHHTPFFSKNKQLMPGVEIHANFIEMALRQDYLREFSYIKFLIIFFILSFLLFFMNLSMKPTFSIIINLLLLVGYLGYSYYLFVQKSLLIPTLEIPVLIVVIYIAGLIFQYLKTLQERKFIKHAFGHYIAPELVDELLQDPKKLEYGGEQKELTVLYSDIVSFTPYAESHSPKETVDILREYLTEMVEVITNNKGTLDKFVGDEIVALFGAPVYLEDHAYWGCKAALEMRQRINELKEKWKAEKKDPFEIGIGLNSGVMTVGNLGSEQIFDYTAIGDNMNAGARIEALTRDYKTKSNIIISESTYQMAEENIIASFIDEVKVKGKTKKITIYELQGLKKEV